MCRYLGKSTGTPLYTRREICVGILGFYYCEREIIEYLTQVAFPMSSPRVEGRCVVYKEKRAAGGDLGRQVSQLANCPVVSLSLRVSL